MTATYDLRAHTADVAIEATGKTLSSVFSALADGLAAAHLDTIPEAGGRKLTISVTAESKTAALFDYLDRLLYVRDVEGVLPVDNNATIEQRDNGWVVDGTASGIDLSTVSAREVKAITYSEMELDERDEGFHAYVVVDV